MIDKVRDFISKYALIDKNDKVLIAFSGGVDSVVLFDLLYRLKDEMGFSLIAVHFDHMIRENSSDDAVFVQEYCKRHGIKLHLSQGDAPACAAQEKLSLEAAARKLRHAYIRYVAEKIGAHKIAFAHHKNDRAETYLMRVLRGTGGDGLGCMPECDGMIIRPLLCAEKEEIAHYAKINRLPWREDETNSDTAYTRNNIRHNTIPHLKENYNESIVNTLSNNARLMSVDRDYFEQTVQKALKKAKQTDDGYYLDDDSFIYLHKAILTRCIRKTLSMLGFESDIYESNINDVLTLFYEQKTGAMVNLPSGAIARRDAFGVEIIRDEEAPPIFCETPLEIPGITFVAECGTFQCTESDADLKKIKNHSKNVAFFDTMSVCGKYTIRSRQTGDVFHPLGAPGSKPLKKYFIDKKISRFKRDYIPLVACGNEILWIVGHEISDKVKLSEDSISAIKIIYKKI